MRVLITGGCGALLTADWRSPCWSIAKTLSRIHVSRRWRSRSPRVGGGYVCGRSGACLGVFRSRSSRACGYRCMTLGPCPGATLCRVLLQPFAVSQAHLSRCPAGTVVRAVQSAVMSLVWRVSFTLPDRSGTEGLASAGVRAPPYASLNVVVAYPTLADEGCPARTHTHTAISFSESRTLVMMYPALPRVLKCIEVLREDLKRLLPAARGTVDLRLTLSDTENPYARDLFQQFSSVCGVRFIGWQTQQQIVDAYRACDVVVHPSRLETWGLPITEAKALNKPLLVADLPYARETVGNCAAVSFLSATDAQARATCLTRSRVVRTRSEASPELPPRPHSPQTAHSCSGCSPKTFE